MNVIRTYELMPNDGRKSFYGKARVEVYEDGSEGLISYTTKVLTKTKEGQIIRHWNDYSVTTQRHINAYCGLNKKEWMAMEVVR